MIKISVVKKNNNIMVIEATGHSGYAEEGSDIICSAVSTLIQNLPLSLQKLLSIDAYVVCNTEKPFYSIVLPEGLSTDKMQQAQLLMQSTLLGLKDLANQFKKFIKIKEK